MWSPVLALWFIWILYGYSSSSLLKPRRVLKKNLRFSFERFHFKPEYLNSQGQ